MFPHGFGPHASRARVGRRALPGSIRRSWRTTTSGPSGTSTAPPTRLARHLAAQGVGPGDRVAVMTSNRPEFVVAVHAVSKLGAAAVLLNPAWKALEVEHAVGLTAPRYGVADGPAPRCCPSASARTPVLDLDDAAAASGDRPHRAARARARRRPCGRATTPCCVFSSGTTDRPEGGAPHAPLHRPGHRSTGSPRSASVTTTGSRWRPRRRTSSAC